MQLLSNPYRGQTLSLPAGGDLTVATDPAPVAGLLASCPAAAATPLLPRPDLARSAGVAELFLKDERGRMGLGSFKALGAASVIARDAVAAAGRLPSPQEAGTALIGRTYVAASAGNHGLSVAAGARVFGADAVIVLSETVPEAFADRLRAAGASIERRGATYEDSMAAAAGLAASQGWTLLSDSSWDGYLDLPRRVMEGYLAMASEAAGQISAPPTHVILQAGVGGMAAALAAFARAHWGEGPAIVVVEPEAAPALFESIRQGRPVKAAGPVSAMGRLDCKEPSLLALSALARDADLFCTIGEDEAADGVRRLSEAGLETTPSGAAGFAALLAAAGDDTASPFPGDARVLLFLTEGPEAP